MANFIRNRIEIVGTKEEVKEVFEKYNTIDDDGLIQFPDFNKVIPQPENIFQGNLGEKEYEMCKREGRPTWKDWNIENWGTKWNCFECDKESDNAFTFETAWSGVPLIIEAMSNQFPNVEFTYDYADEEIGSNCGSYKSKNGEMLEYHPQSGSKEAYEFAFKLWPDMEEYYEYVDECYHYVDED